MINCLDFRENACRQEELETLIIKGEDTKLEELLEFQDDLVAEVRANKERTQN